MLRKGVVHFGFRSTALRSLRLFAATPISGSRINPLGAPGFFCQHPAVVSDRLRSSAERPSCGTETCDLEACSFGLTTDRPGQESKPSHFRSRAPNSGSDP